MYRIELHYKRQALFVVVEVSEDCVEVLQHDVGVVGGEGQGGSEPDAATATPAQVDALLTEVVKDLVPQLQADHVNSTESSQATSSGQDLRESLLKIVQSPHHGPPSLVDKIKQGFFLQNFDNLRTHI